MIPANERKPGLPAGEPSGSPLEAESTYRLMRRVDEGDDMALDRLCRRYMARLQRWARGRLPARVRDMVDTDDLVQDVLGGMIRRLSSFEYRRRRALQAYVRMALDNRIREELRRCHLEPAAETALERIPSPQRSPLETLLGRELIGRYEAALLRLRPEDREAIVAKLEMGCGYAEVADALDKPSADAARKAVARAVVRLAREMSEGRA